SRSTIPADEITLNGMPFQTPVSPPPRNVGTPDSAETPAPVSMSTLFASLKRSRSSSEIVCFVAACMVQSRMVAKRPTKSQFRDSSLIPYNSRLLLRSEPTEEDKACGSLSLWERVRVRVLAPKRDKTIFFRFCNYAPHPSPLPKEREFERLVENRE